LAILISKPQIFKKMSVINNTLAFFRSKKIFGRFYLLKIYKQKTHEYYSKKLDIITGKPSDYFSIFFNSCRLFFAQYFPLHFGHWIFVSKPYQHGLQQQFMLQRGNEKEVPQKTLINGKRYKKPQ
jgi:hypothetical protein